MSCRVATSSRRRFWMEPTTADTWTCSSAWPLVARPEDWPWSGYPATVGLERPRPFHDTLQLLAYFGTRPQIAAARYEQFVREGLVRSGHVAWSDQGYESRTGPG